MFMAVLASVDNLTKSKLDKEEALTLKCFFLLLRKESVINDSIAFYSAKVAKTTLNNLILNNADLRIVELYEKYIKQIIEKSYSKYIFDLVGPFARLSDDFINEYANELIHFLLSGFLNRSSDYAAMQPKELTTIMNHFLKGEDYKSYYNPFSGVSSLATDIPEQIIFFGEEINQFVWLLGQIRILIQNPNLNYSVENSDSVFNTDPSLKFDFIAFNPPPVLKSDFVKLNTLQNEFVYNKSNTHGFIIRENLKRLKYNGRTVFLITSWFLNNAEDKGLREFLVKNNFLEYVISLPKNILNYSGVKTYLIVLSKKVDKPKDVKFVDAYNLYLNNNNKISILNANKIIELIDSSEENEFVKYADNVQIDNNDYNFSLPLYLNYLPKTDGNEVLIPFNKLVEQTSGLVIKNLADQDIPKKGKWIEDIDLYHYEKYEGFRLNMDDIKESELVPEVNELDGIEDLPAGLPALMKDTKRIDFSCIIYLGSNSPSMYFEYENEPLYILENTIRLYKVNSSIIDIAYLTNELNSDYVQKQLNSFGRGEDMFIMDDKYILSVKIKVPSIDIQKARVEGVIQGLIFAKEEINNLKKKTQQLKEEAYNDAASARHTFRQYLGALKSSVIGTRKFINNRSGQKIALEDIYSRNLNQTLSDHLKSQESAIQALSKLLEEKKESIGENVKQHNLVDLVKMAHQRFKQDNFEFEFKIDQPAFSQDDKRIKPFINIDEDDFFKLYINIIQNAVDHGFKNRNNNIIHSYISYDSEKQHCILEVSNNGNPIPEKFTLKNLTTRGEKTTDSKGTGIGGADIKDIVTLYNGTFELIKDSISTFPVTYLLSFPMNKIKYDEI